ncbi:MAG: hypothetical protein P1V97_26480 [Planctomycetota bacterium]|nr:hypothetical protein [Planctomycetota bacterium]
MGISKKFAFELRSALQTQNHLINRLTSDLDRAESQLSSVYEQAADLIELQMMMAELEANQHLLETEDFDDFDPSEIDEIYARHQQSISNQLPTLPDDNWKSFVSSCVAYDAQHGLDPLLPYETFLTKTDREQLNSESYDAQYRWDKWDYIFVGASGVLAALTDYMLVGIPKTMKSVLGSSLYEAQEGSPLTAWVRSLINSDNDNWFGTWATSLEQSCRVPYDSTRIFNGESMERIAGMFPRSHRLQSLGHDPILGFIFGVLDIMKGTLTGFSYDTLTRTHEVFSGAVSTTYEPVGFITALLKQIGHLISDIGTSQGLPPPFFTIFQEINIGSFGAKGTPIGGVARWMYLNGYDLRHFLASGVTPGVIEIILRAYLMIRHYKEHGETKFALASNPKYRSMFLTAHGIAAAANAGKVALYQGNPLAINYAEWMAFFRYLVPHMKYWLFDKSRLRLEHMESINEQGWNDIERQSSELMRLVASESFQTVELGQRGD